MVIPFQRNMSINVTVNGNPINIRRGRMVLSDLDQIKKNERDRRRRLRLEQVRQQSKEISNRLLERAKNIAKDELKKLEKSENSNLKQMHDRKIMEIQQKYQEDMADIGHAHASATLQPDEDAIIEEERRKNRTLALKRGKDAAHQMKEMQEKETPEQMHQERLRQVRDLENVRSSMIAKLPQKITPEKHTMHDSLLEERDDENSHSKCSKKKKPKKLLSKKSPGKVTKSFVKLIGSDIKTHSSVLKSATARTSPNVLLQQTTVNSESRPSPSKEITKDVECTGCISGFESDTKTPRKTVPLLNISPTKADKIAKYNPEDYTQETSTSTDSSDSISDDSSYFSDSSDHPKCVKTPRHHNSPADSKVRLYDHSTRQRNLYDRPVGVVEKLDTRNEPSAVDLAREVQQAESVETQLVENRKYNAQRRGEDALLREKVQRDYQALMQNLDQFAREERKLKASQIQFYPNDVNMRERQTNILRSWHKKNLDHALKSMLNQTCSEECTSRPTEKIITLPPREHEASDKIPHGIWQEPYCTNRHAETNEDVQHKSNEDGKSREEQILDMLKKVERQKRLLLQEFGADLPSDIFNASMKPLFETEKSHAPSQSTPPQRPLSPEIRVINMSSCDEDNKKSKAKKKSKSPVQKVEIAVQTATADTTNTAQDKSIQVEFLPEKDKKIDSTSSEIDVATIKHYPIEPKVTVIRPEVDSSESTSSVVTGVTIDIDKQEVKVTPQKKKSTVKTTKRIPSKMFQKSRSVPASKSSSPVKRFSKSLPSSRQSSPKKISCNTVDTHSKRIDIYVNETGFNIKLEPSQVRKVGVDASTQSSQLHSMGVREQSTTKPYRIQSRTKRIIQIKDTSDTSTSFASPPPAKPRNILEALKNNTPILEMLDSSASESIRLLKRDISPVSTPETPSPRTMMMPSNMPHPDRISRILKYASIESQTNDSTTLSSLKNDQSVSTDPLDYQHDDISSHYQQDERMSPQYTVTTSKEPSVSSQLCTCKNPQCRLMHTKFDEIHNYALKNCPQILKKYEDLQNMCTERIASLTDLIEKVRSEQKGMELSVISPGDETSLMQLPSSKPVSNDLQSVRRLVESIEAIHNQLAKTLIESQRIIKNEVPVEKATNEDKDIETITPPNETMHKNKTEYVEYKTQIQKAKAKPKIISDERVNIQLDRFKIQHKPQTLTAAMSERNSWPPQKFHEEDMIEKLSKEILEQSKGLSKSNNISIVTRDISNSSPKNVAQTSTSTNNSKKDVSQLRQREDIAVKEENSSNDSKKNEEFVPLLAGIPKVPRPGANSTASSGRGKPPVTLHSGPYRSEIESSGHELSTIAEFDTPDTVNKSQTNTRSPSPVKRTTETQSVKSSITIKPSVNVAPILTLHNQHLIPGKSHQLLSAKLSSAIVSLHGQQECEALCNSPKASNNTKNRASPLKSEDEKWANFVREKTSKRSKCDTSNQDILIQTEELRLLSSISTDSNNKCKSNKDKITSTSSNSFSGLSGISEITSTPSSDILKYASSPEEIETALKKHGLCWALTTLKKTREASALSSSSNSDVTPINTARRMISPAKKQLDSNTCGLPDFSDVSSISIKEASKSTEQAVLLKGRTSTPKMQNSNSNSTRTNCSSTNTSENFQEGSDSLIVPNMSLTKAKSNMRKLEKL